MTDLTKLKELAERATPGPWSCNRHWAIVGGPILEFTNGAAQQQIAMACGQSWMHDEELRNNAEWIAAANPAAVLELIAEVERLRKVEALQKQVNEHYKRWYRECIDEPFDTWLKDDATHWIGEQDAAFQAWQYLHENKIWLMKERIEEHEQERDRLKAENEALRESLQALIHISDATGWEDHTCGEIAKARAALEGATQ
ncbi:TPA: ead/Ea22-like family protein [Pseudomonas aeruginosa]